MGETHSPVIWHAADKQGRVGESRIARLCGRADKQTGRRAPTVDAAG